MSSSQLIQFTPQTQIQLFTHLKRSRFSGRVILQTEEETAEQWTFYFYLGRIIYATGGEHRMRRWERSLMAQSMDLYYLWVQKKIPQECDNSESFCLTCLKEDVCWEYQVLCTWVATQKMTTEDAMQNVRFTLTEILFDIQHQRQVSYCVVPDKMFSARLILSDTGEVIRKAHEQFVAWQKAKLADRSPNSLPMLHQPEIFQNQVPNDVYQVFSRLLNGKHTIRDIALKMKRDMTAIAAYLLPHVQSGTIELKQGPDFPALVIPHIDNSPPQKNQNINEQDILVACIDDSVLICQTMETIIHDAGYGFLSVNDPLRAIAILLARKPDIIFLDLVMPNANGYEICSQLRKLSIFKNTPIVILTGNDGIVDRVRAKLVGSSDFLSKPVDGEAVIGLIQKYVYHSSSS
ncbi:MAG: response regulator [Snowella sp.]|nr:response regulator [Snowella sp.]